MSWGVDISLALFVCSKRCCSGRRNKDERLLNLYVRQIFLEKVFNDFIDLHFGILYKRVLMLLVFRATTRASGFIFSGFPYSNSSGQAMGGNACWGAFSRAFHKLVESKADVVMDVRTPVRESIESRQKGAPPYPLPLPPSMGLDSVLSCSNPSSGISLRSLVVFGTYDKIKSVCCWT